MRANCDIVGVRMPGPGRAPVVWIVDMCDQHGSLSVTNDAEAVCKNLHPRYPHHRIIYRDTDGRWDEIVHDAGVFKGFAPIRDPQLIPSLTARRRA